MPRTQKARQRPARKNLKQLQISKTQCLSSQSQELTAPNKGTIQKRAEHRSQRLKPEHKIVLRAVEIANRALQRVVNVGEVLKALTPKEVKRLETTYAKELSSAVCVILHLLCVRGCIFSPGKVSDRNYYGLTSILGSAPPLPTLEQSRRQRVLRLVRQTVEKLGRAVRMSDILEYAAASPEASALVPIDISHDVLSLKETGELRHVGSLRGDGKGINLYLPSHLSLEEYALPDSLTWLQAVAQTFGELWTERARQAVATGVNPRPLSTGEVRARLRASVQYAEQYAENLADPMVVVNAMQQLARSSNPVVCKINRPGQRAVLWAPPDVGANDLDVGDAYANDMERIEEAVRRAEYALNRPVRVRDIQDQVELDPSLQPNSSSRLYSQVSQAAKETASDENGKRRRRAKQRIYRIGKIADDSYYSISRTAEAMSFIEFGRLELRWAALRVDEQLNMLEVCSLPCVATGRVRLLVTELNDIRRDFRSLRESGHLRGDPLHRANELQEHVRQFSNATRKWLANHALDDPRLPQEVDTTVRGWTADELLTVIKPLYRTSQKLKKGTKLVSLMSDAVRRIPNPEYVNRFSKDQRLASEYLFDRTDALIYIAKEWGGYECCLQATLAANELGWLRDPRFVIPALESPDFNARLSAVACLAFLSSELGNARLRVIAISDPDSGVRQSALWAYGFAGGNGTLALLEGRSQCDPDSRVRSFAQHILLNSEESCWAL
jgi:hypothetical protein